MQSKATTVEQYLASLPADRRAALGTVRETILRNLDRDFEEGMQYGMIGYYVPHRVYPAGYHCNPRQPLPFAALAAQKNYMSFYIMSVYANSEHETWFRKAWAKTGKKLDLGKCCVRFRKLEDLALEVIGQAVRRVSVKAYIEHYESVLRTTRKAAPKRAASSGRTATPGTATRSRPAAKKPPARAKPAPAATASSAGTKPSPSVKRTRTR